jgi:hypothetical protein
MFARLTVETALIVSNGATMYRPQVFDNFAIVPVATRFLTNMMER